MVNFRAKPKSFIQTPRSIFKQIRSFFRYLKLHMCHSNLGLAITYVGSLGITGGGTGKNLVEVISVSVVELITAIDASLARPEAAEVSSAVELLLLVRFVCSIVVPTTAGPGLGGRRISLSSFIHPVVTMLKVT